MSKDREKTLSMLPYYTVFAIIIHVGACSGLPTQVFSAPEKNVIPDYIGAVTKHQVLNVIWRMPLVDPGYESTENHRFGAPATSKDGKRVFAGAKDGSFFCLDASTGEIFWRSLTEGPIEGEPLVTDEVVYVGSGDGKIYAFRLSDGQELWNYSGSRAFMGRLALYDDKLIGMTNDNSLFCLDTQTGKLIWSYRRDAPFGLFQVRGVASPLVNDDKVYAGFSDGSLVTLSLENGKVLSTKNFSKKDANFIDMDTDPIIIDSMLITGSFSNGIVALDVNNQDEIWHYQAEGPSSVAYDEKSKMLYFSTAKSKIWALNAADGKPKWSFVARKGSLSRPVVSNSWIFISSSEYSLLVLERSTGKLIQIFNPGKGSHSTPFIKSNRAYWISNGEVLYAMEIRK